MTTTTNAPKRTQQVDFEKLLEVAPANDVDRRSPDPMAGQARPIALSLVTFAVAA